MVCLYSLGTYLNNCNFAKKFKDLKFIWFIGIDS